MREEMLKKHPEVGTALDALAGAISDDDMRRLNYAVDGHHRDAAVVVREFLHERKLVN
jgi:glycine betaine/choline ABC-type transport system substrate-binding protein